MSTPTSPNSADRALPVAANDILDELATFDIMKRRERALALMWKYRDAHRASAVAEAVAGLEAKITQLEILIGREKAEVEFHRKDAAPRLKKVLNHLHQHMEEIIAIESSHRDTPDNATLSTARNALKYEHL